MKYLLLVHIDRQIIGALTPAEDKAQIRESLDYDRELIDKGHLIAAHALAEPEAATIIRNRNGRVSMTDGPYVETKEHVGGFMLIEAKDLNEAVAVAAKAPVARFGAIEVRPIVELEP
ncbi:MAG TPA: YciI family protein [Alphaproteobacteria bacterium]|nr:YciI family protein [Alphaproteobacteria bacterium]